jgi:hypothetical protein
MSYVELKDTTGLSERAKRLCKIAVLRTWARTQLPYPLKFKVRVGAVFTNNKILAEYNPETDIVALAADNIRSDFKMNIGSSLALCVSHEITHRAQFLRGQKPTPSYRNWRYNDCPFEDEAWREAAITFKEIYPMSSGYIDVDGKRYEIA